MDQDPRIGNLLQIPNIYVVAFKKMPPPIPSMGDTEWFFNPIQVASQQMVFVIDSNKSPTQANLYYKCLFKEGILWLHYYDSLDIKV